MLKWLQFSANLQQGGNECGRGAPQKYLTPLPFQPRGWFAPHSPKDKCFEQTQCGQNRRSGKEFLYYRKRPRVPALLEQVAAPRPPATTEVRSPDSEAVPAPRDAPPCSPAPGEPARRPALRGCEPSRLALAGLCGLGPARYYSLLLSREFASMGRPDPKKESNLVLFPNLPVLPFIY